MMRYSTEDEKDYQEFLKKEKHYLKEFLKEQEIKDIKTCDKCFFFTENKEHEQYRCSGGNSCPTSIAYKEKDSAMSKM